MRAYVTNMSGERISDFGSPLRHSMLETRSGTTPRTWSALSAVVIARLRDLAPYAAIELVMPGGSVMALLLWLYRRRKNAP
jgi:hypothetical protein